ncbi:MAG: FAD-dependent oxidoreductase, partial [Deltaproteobacteria bacterium]|nr:FAD-dependent oxidoreductase [Deltaproteobacteria bacterium]
WEEVTKDFKAIYVAVGAHHSLAMGLQGEDLEGVVGAVEFLREVNLGQKPAVGQKVAVIGGGNSAVDAARSALRLGAEEVTIVYRRLRDDMPAQEAEIKAAEEEGVNIQYLVAPNRYRGDNGQVKGVVCQRMSLGQFDSSGRRRPLPIAGAEFELEADMVISAISQRPELTFWKTESSDQDQVTKDGLIKTNDQTHCRVGQALVFAGGDAVSGPGTVIRAIAEGHRAAAEIDAAIRAENGEPAYEAPPQEEIDLPGIIDEEIKETPRAAMPQAPASERIMDFREVELGFSQDVALAEARRCLRCDVQEETV